METHFWNTEYAHNDNNQTMQEYLDDFCILDITHIDGSYAEGINAKGDIYSIIASGNGDFCNHKVEFKKLN